MRVYISPSQPTGTTIAISSKSMLHRLLICSAFSDRVTTILCNNSSEDIQATIKCLQLLGVRITPINQGYRVVPLPCNRDTGRLQAQTHQLLNAGKSGTTLRFMTAILSALGQTNFIDADEQLRARPMSELLEELVVGGADINPDFTYPLHISGALRPGRYELPGNISSQYVSALLLAAPLLNGSTQVVVKKPLESKSYVSLTIEAMGMFGVEVTEEATEESITYTVDPGGYKTPGDVFCEGDWSQASVWLALGALSKDVIGVEGLNMHSDQPDRAILGALSILGARVLRRQQAVYVRHDQMRPFSINCADCPDLTPALALMAACTPGTCTLTGLSRLKFKESNRIDAIAYSLESFGIEVQKDEDSLTIQGGTPVAPRFVLDPHDDHRICMLQALLATQADGVCAIDNCEVIAKSYPTFFEAMEELNLAIKLEN